jgi:hypothetical protein
METSKDLRNVKPLQKTQISIDVSTKIVKKNENTIISGIRLKSVPEGKELTFKASCLSVGQMSFLDQTGSEIVHTATIDILQPLLDSGGLVFTPGSEFLGRTAITLSLSFMGDDLSCGAGSAADGACLCADPASPGTNCISESKEIVDHFTISILAIN